MRKYIRTVPYKRIPLNERFWKYVEKNDGCWNWIGDLDKKGYGRINSGGNNGKILFAHRASWMIHFGEPDKHVCHHCDNPRCVRPDHLFLGTDKDNMADMSRKGRGPGPHFLGEDHPMAKLTNRQVEEIKEALKSYKKGDRTIRTLAKKYGVHYQTIWRYNLTK